MRWLQGSHGMVRVERDQFHLRLCLTPENLGHDFAIHCLRHDAVALAHLRTRRDDDAVALAIGRLHAVACDLQGIDGFVAKAWKPDLVPTAADRKAAIIKKAVCAGLGKADERGGRPPPAFNKGCEIIHAGANRVERAGKALT